MQGSMLTIVPTRSRPQNIDELLTVFELTRTDEDLLVAVDDDDPELANYVEVVKKHDLPSWFTLYTGPRLRLAGTLNHLAKMHSGDYKVIGFMGDDHRPRTNAWDKMILDVCAGGTRIAYGNDLIQGPNLPTAVFMTSDIIMTLGYMVPPTLTHLFLDNFWKTLGEQIGRLTYLPNVIIEHVHPISGKAQWDDQYVQVNSQDQWNQDEYAWNDYVGSGLLTRDIRAITSTW